MKDGVWIFELNLIFIMEDKSKIQKDEVEEEINEISE